jgi:hypothetical protein
VLSGENAPSTGVRLHAPEYCEYPKSERFTLSGTVVFYSKVLES